MYALDTGAFFTEDEIRLDKKLRRARALLHIWHEHHDKKPIKKGSCRSPTYRKYRDTGFQISRSQKKYVSRLNKIAAETKEKLKAAIAKNIGIVRTVNENSLNEHNIVAVFDSELTRALKMSHEGLNLQMVIVKVYYFGVCESIIKHGFDMNGRHYVFFSSSAGQIRTKKLVAVDEKLLNEQWNTLTCGLSLETINKAGGVNPNKYLAYTALCNSATQIWHEFDINKSIVIDDFETAVLGTVDFIDEHDYSIERKETDVIITHTDGCGMVLPSLCSKNFMVRAPWMKGLLSPFPFDKFIREARRRGAQNCGIVKDIYGVEHDVLKENIEVIFTASQFKMHKYYKSWKEYQENFRAYHCHACRCNMEEDVIGDAKFNYQMLQTLNDITDDELTKLCSKTNKTLHDLSSDRKTMLKVFGAVPTNNCRNWFQECLMLYPELLQDAYSRESLREIRNSIEKWAKGGRFEIDGKYLFVIPDLYAACQFWFLGIDKPEGLLQNGDVYCSIYRDREWLDCLRSPHLYREHPVRRNVAGEDGERKRWFVTNGIYTSSHDLISKVLQFDK